MSSKGNPTGFDIRKLAASSGQHPSDPWKRYEQWRYTGPFTRWNRFKSGFPGLGIATVAFAAYCGYEYMFLNDSHGTHGKEDHGKDHH